MLHQDVSAREKLDLDLETDTASYILADTLIGSANNISSTYSNSASSQISIHTLSSDKTINENATDYIFEEFADLLCRKDDFMLSLIFQGAAERNLIDPIRLRRKLSQLLESYGSIQKKSDSDVQKITEVRYNSLRSWLVAQSICIGPRDQRSRELHKSAEVDSCKAEKYLWEMLDRAAIEQA
jgi:hypothetical protein